MQFYDGISRGNVFKKLTETRRKLLEKITLPGPSPDEVEQIRYMAQGIDIAISIVAGELPAGKWNDPEDKRYKIPEGTQLLVEITQGNLQRTDMAAFYKGEWSKISHHIPARTVTGWQLPPEPRKEKRYD